MINIVLGLALLLATYWMVRKAGPRPDGSRPTFMKRQGIDTAVALLATTFIAIGTGLLIQGGFGLSADAAAVWATLR